MAVDVEISNCNAVDGVGWVDIRIVGSRVQEDLGGGRPGTGGDDGGSNICRNGVELCYGK